MLFEGVFPTPHATHATELVLSTSDSAFPQNESGLLYVNSCYIHLSNLPSATCILTGGTFHSVFSARALIYHAVSSHYTTFPFWKIAR